MDTCIIATPHVLLKGNVMRHRLSLTLGLLVLCASLAACGGSGTTATATTASPTRAATAVSGAASASAPAVATTAPTTAPSAAAAATRPAGSASAASSPTIAAASAPTVAAASAASAVSGGNVVMVQLKDFAIMLDKSTVSAGMVTFNIRNNGPSPHNF